MPSVKLGRDKYQFCKSSVCLDWEPNSRSLARETTKKWGGRKQLATGQQPVSEQSVTSWLIDHRPPGDHLSCKQMVRRLQMLHPIPPCDKKTKRRWPRHCQPFPVCLWLVAERSLINRWSIADHCFSCLSFVVCFGYKNITILAVDKWSQAIVCICLFVVVFRPSNI